MDGHPALANAGQERFDGVELDAEVSLGEGWSAVATYAWHDATFTDYEQTFDGVLTSLDGHRLEMSPEHLVSAGAAWNGGSFHAQASGNYVGERFLNRRNTAVADSYVTVDAAGGYRTGRLELWVAGRNLTDRRDPVSESELGESQYYRMPARHLELGTTFDL